MIEINSVVKQFYDFTALDRLSLTIPQGVVLGVLGPNGAGKSTFLKLLAGVLQPTAGTIQPMGMRWPSVGYKPQRLRYPEQLRVKDYLMLVAQVSNISKRQASQLVVDSLHRVDLLGAADQRIGACSEGMRQRLSLAQILVGDPSLVLLDEPSSGLDEAGQALVLQLVSELQAAGKTVIMSSHMLTEVTAVCSELIILKNGRLFYHNSVADALMASAYAQIEVDRPLQPLHSYLHPLHHHIEINQQTVRLKNEAMGLRRQVLGMLIEADYDILKLQHHYKKPLAEIYSEAMQ